MVQGGWNDTEWYDQNFQSNHIAAQVFVWEKGRQRTIICMSSENDYYRYKNINYYRCVKWKTIIGMSSENTIIGMSCQVKNTKDWTS